MGERLTPPHSTRVGHLAPYFGVISLVIPAWAEMTSPIMPLSLCLYPIHPCSKLWAKRAAKQDTVSSHVGITVHDQGSSGHL